ncbi:hypothetical protein KUTeg_011138 [Tegillarca granosa]|uniref:Uncharacterized protein n=1 Tax=Tegillarca granosa TaxID=220873 RepID=A0ABQ9F6X1_TEGGR|nr:hypothetical protein KUTeg_011138 [Tegillarca granosa]
MFYVCGLEFWFVMTQNNDIQQQILQQSGRGHKRPRVILPTIPNMMQCREIGANKGQMFTEGDRRAIYCQFLPNHMRTVAKYGHKAFCGTFSRDGNIFLNASQDQNIRIYDTAQGKFNLIKTIRARDVGWSVLDTAFRYFNCLILVLMVTWYIQVGQIVSVTHYFLFIIEVAILLVKEFYHIFYFTVHLCNIYGEHETHEALHLFPGDHSFCIFSLTFSSDNQEVLGGLIQMTALFFICSAHIDAHDDDVNAVSYADNSSHILFSGADDGLVKAWDRRTLREDRPEPIATLAGHADGITFIDTKGDGRYLISNSKDQTIKLWDIRKVSTKEAIEATRKTVAKQRWDYRWQKAPSYVTKMKKLPGDSSLMTYIGHSIRHTLIRARFSPEFTTGQRYIYTGCATGNLVVYDLLTGKIVSKLNGHKACVRDVSWHPYENILVSTSWDGTVGKWEYLYRDESDMDNSIEDDTTSSGSDSDTPISRRTRSNRGFTKMTKKIPKECYLLNHHGLFE